MIFLISSTVLNIVFNRFFRILKIFILLKLETLSISYFYCFIFLNFYFIRINCFFYSSRLAGVLLWFFFWFLFCSLVYWFTYIFSAFLMVWYILYNSGLPLTHGKPSCFNLCVQGLQVWGTSFILFLYS